MVNQAIRKEVGKNPRLSGMGTTLSVCYTTGSEMFVVHAGDSRVYLHRGGKLSRLTRDHNMAQLLIDTGTVRPDSAEARRVQHVLTNVLGGPDDQLVVDVGRHQLADGDRLLLCTDGLSDMVSDADIAHVLETHAASEDACVALESLALERGGRDNITIVVARYTLLAELTPGERVGIT
jgi:protein phosphatase